jgi:hypothetical protein
MIASGMRGRSLTPPIFDAEGDHVGSFADYRQNPLPIGSTKAQPEVRESADQWRETNEQRE